MLEFVFLTIILVVIFYQFLTLFHTTILVNVFVYLLLFGFVIYYGKTVFQANDFELYSYSSRACYLYPELSADCDHDGIVFIHYTDIRKECCILDNISLLTEGYRRLNRPYKIYHVYSRNNFETIYTDPGIRGLWIFGHGIKKGFIYEGDTETGFVDYSTLPEGGPKEFIMQLHSTCGGGKSLAEINHVKNRDLSYINTRIHFAFVTRCVVQMKLAALEAEYR